MAGFRIRSELPQAADLVIVGGGVVGAATAFYARRGGLAPLVLERRPMPCMLTTPASTGAFRLQFDNEEEIELVRESAELFLSFREATGQSAYDLGLRQQGYLWLTTDQERAARQRELVARQHAWGLDDVELLGGDEVRARFPHVAAEVIQGRFRQGDGFLDPKQLTFGLLEGAAADIVTECDVTGLSVERNRLTGVETSRGAVDCARVVIAGGPFSREIAATAGVDLPLVAVARHKIVLPDVPEVPREAPMTIDDDTGAHWRPALNGAYALFTDPDAEPSEPADPVPPDGGFADRVLDPSSPVSIARVTPFWADVWRRGCARWMLQSGQYTVTPDHRPLIGKTPVEGLFVNTGYSGHGVMAGPAGSRRLVDVLTGTIQESANPFRLDRVFEARAHDLL